MDKVCLLDCEAAKELDRENKKLKECLGFNPEVEKANLSHLDALVVLDKIYSSAQKCLKELEAGE